MVTFVLVAYLILTAAAVLRLVIKTSIPLVHLGAHAGRTGRPLLPETVDVVFFLVHGTWAKDAAWTRDGSALTDALYAVAPKKVVIERLPWSGRNSVGARQRGVERLSSRLAAVTKSFPFAQHFIVAHSHGGNIVLYALNEPELARKIQGVVCLSTPFLNVRQRNLGGIRRSSLVAAVFVGPMYLSGWLLERRFPRHESLNFAVAIAIGLLGGLFLMWKAASVTDRLSQSLKLGALASDRLLIVRAAGDEASAALSALQLASWLATQCWAWPAVFADSVKSTVREWSDLAAAHWKEALTLAFTGAVLALGSASLFANQTLATISFRVGAVLLSCGSAILLIPWVGSGGSFYGYFFNFILSGIALFPLLAILAVLVIPFGWELAIACTRLDVTVEATPPGTWVVHQLPPLNDGQLNDLGMSHAATHERADAIDAVRRWVETKVANV